MNEDHKEIYLEPLFVPRVADEQDWYDPDGRQWCQDNVWCEHDYHGEKATRYIRADLYEGLEDRIKELEDVMEGIRCADDGFVWAQYFGAELYEKFVLLGTHKKEAESNKKDNKKHNCI